MKKKLISMLCILAMIISVMPVQMVMAANTSLSIISGNTYDTNDIKKYNEMGYDISYVGNTTSYTWDSSLLDATTGKYGADPECVKLKGGNVGKWTDNSGSTVWNNNQISYWDLGDVYPLNKVDIWSRYNLCNVKIYAKANEDDEYVLVASHQAADNSAGASTPLQSV